MYQNVYERKQAGYQITPRVDIRDRDIVRVVSPDRSERQLGLIIITRLKPDPFGLGLGTRSRIVRQHG